MGSSRDHFRLRSYQQKPFVARQNGCKRFVEVLHRRAGKDRSWLNITLTEMIRTRGVYFHVFPSLNQGKRDLWDNIISETVDGVVHRFPALDMFPPELVISRNESEMQIKLATGSIWQIMGADDDEAISRLRGPNPIGIVFSEYAHMKPEVWDVLSPVLAENGGWASFIYTPNGKNHGWDQYRYAKSDPTWFCQLLTIDETRRDAEGEDGSPVIDIEEIEDFRRHGMREERIQQEYYCSFEGFQHGTIYGDLMQIARAEGRVTRVPYLSSKPVGVCFDLGHTDATAMWFYQLVDDRINWIDYHEDTQKPMSVYAQVLREQKRYMYGKILLPFDGRIAEEYLSSIGFQDVQVVDRPRSVQAEIELVRREFSRMYFDEVLCARGIRCVEEYHRKWDEEKRAFSVTPYHDQWSHGADALRTGVVGGLGPMMFSGQISQNEIKVETTFDLGTRLF
jgi:phage terminase large subunit